MNDKQIIKELDEMLKYFLKQEELLRFFNNIDYRF